MLGIRHWRNIIDVKARFEEESSVDFLHIRSWGSECLKKGFEDEFDSQRLGSNHATDSLKGFGVTLHGGQSCVGSGTTTEEADGHAARIWAATDVLERAKNIAPLVETKETVVATSTMAVVAQVIGKNVVPSIMKDLVVRDEVDIKVIARDERIPWL